MRTDRNKAAIPKIQNQEFLATAWCSRKRTFDILARVLAFLGFLRVFVSPKIRPLFSSQSSLFLVFQLRPNGRLSVWLSIMSTTLPFPFLSVIYYCLLMYSMLFSAFIYFIDRCCSQNQTEFGQNQKEGETIF